MFKKTSFLNSYSTRYKSKEIHKSQSPVSSQVPASPTKTISKLPQLNSSIDHSPLPRSHRQLFKNSSIITPIQAKSSVYEKAIKDHLGIKDLSKDSSFSSLPTSIPKPAWATPKAKLKSLDFSSLALIEQEESRISQIIRKNQTSQKKSHKKASSLNLSTDKDKEIQKVQESLNKINLLLGKILHKREGK